MKKQIWQILDIKGSQHRVRRYMRTLSELEREIHIIRTELEEAYLQHREFEDYYPKSKELDQLINEYMDLKKKEQ